MTLAITPTHKAHVVATKIVKGTAPRIIELLGEDRYRELLEKDAKEIAKRTARVRGAMQMKGQSKVHESALENQAAVIGALKAAGAVVGGKTWMTPTELVEATGRSQTCVRNTVIRMQKKGWVKVREIKHPNGRILQKNIRLLKDAPVGLEGKEKEIVDAIVGEMTTQQIADKFPDQRRSITATLGAMHSKGYLDKRITTRDETPEKPTIMWKVKEQSDG
jgi:predicted transcriptional regulator